MIRNEKDQLCWYEFEAFLTLPVKHGIFTRHGGVSTGHLTSLNMGGTVGDEPHNPRLNQDRMLTALGLPTDRVFDVWQVHSADAIVAKESRPLNTEHEKADIIVTGARDVTLVMRFADCVPLMVYDPVLHAAGIAHAGWIGTGKNVAGALIRAMRDNFGSDPTQLIAGIGPSICREHYPVGEEVVEIFSRQFADQMDEIVFTSQGKPHLDLWRANQIQLQNAGVHQIEIAGICTACHTEDWYSYRGEKGRTGRFGAAIQLI